MNLIFRRSGEPGKAESFYLDCVRMYSNESWPKLNADASERLAKCYKQMCNVRRCLHHFNLTLCIHLLACIAIEVATADGDLHCDLTLVSGCEPFWCRITPRRWLPAVLPSHPYSFIQGNVLFAITTAYIGTMFLQQTLAWIISLQCAYYIPVTSTQCASVNKASELRLSSPLSLQT